MMTTSRQRVREGRRLPDVHVYDRPREGAGRVARLTSNSQPVIGRPPLASLSGPSPRPRRVTPPDRPSPPPPAERPYPSSSTHLPLNMAPRNTQNRALRWAAMSWMSGGHGGHWPATPDSVQRARRHVARLEAIGLSRREIARRAGVAPASVTRLCGPTPASSRPVVAAILAVKRASCRSRPRVCPDPAQGLCACLQRASARSVSPRRRQTRGVHRPLVGAGGSTPNHPTRPTQGRQRHRRQKRAR